MSAWVNIKDKHALCDPECARLRDYGIIEIKSASGSYVTHFEASYDGRIRGRLRGEDHGADINSSCRTHFDGGSEAWPEDEWFHYAQTYDSTATFGGEPGHIVFYIDGEIVKETYADGVSGATSLGGWGMGGFVGRVEDDNRQFHGFMDEVYIYTRALSDAEVKILGTVFTPECLLGDVNLDDAVNGLDVMPFVSLVMGSIYQREGDMNEDGTVNGLDVVHLVAAILAGNTTPIPEPTTLALALIVFLGLAVGRRGCR
jgi:hypothetical protein